MILRVFCSSQEGTEPRGFCHVSGHECPYLCRIPCRPEMARVWVNEGGRWVPLAATDSDEELGPPTEARIASQQSVLAHGHFVHTHFQPTPSSRVRLFSPRCLRRRLRRRRLRRRRWRAHKLWTVIQRVRKYCRVRCAEIRIAFSFCLCLWSLTDRCCRT